MNTINKALPVALLLAAATAQAQIATDGSVGARVTFDGTAREVVIPDSLGRRAGTNLLHSFATFNVIAGQRATFTGVGFIQNIVARITGGSASRIDGTIASAIPGSNLFLVNPSGIVFGPTAAIDVPGSFHASSAHYLKLADGTRIAMSADPNVTLTVAPPAAFGFEGPAAPIALAGAQLRVREGQRISLAGGDVTLAAQGARPSLLFAPSGTVGIVAAQSAGEAVIEANGLRAEGFGAMGHAAIRNSIVSVVEGGARRGAGAISVAGGTVDIDHSTLNSVTTFGAGRGIRLSSAGSLTIDASDVLSVTRGAGDAGPLALRGADITIANGSLVDTSCDPGCTTGNGGPLTVDASGTLTLLGNHPTLPTYLVSNTFGGGRTGTIDIRAGALVASGNALIQGISEASGDGTSITLTTGSITLTGGAQVDVSTRRSGRGGTITVNNSGAIRIEGVRIEDEAAGRKAPSGFFSNTGDRDVPGAASGAAGAIVIDTGSLEILGGAQISTSSIRDARGAAGRIAINVRGALRIAGANDVVVETASGIASNTFTDAPGGDIDITADTIHIGDRGRIQVQSEGRGRAGTARITAREVTLERQGQVSSDARSLGDGGTLELRVAGLLSIDGANTGLFARTYGPARGGSIDVHAGSLRLANEGVIIAGTIGAGHGGDIAVRASDRIEITGGASIDLESLLTGLAGSGEIHAGDSLVMTNGGAINTRARQADGGNVHVDVGRFAFIDGGLITTEVGTGQGSGGNVDLRVPTLVTRAAVITANAFGGDGGNIRIGTTTFLPSPSTRITASSTLGIDGVITFESPALDPTGELLLPPPAFLDAGAVLAGRCGPRLAGRASSLVVAPHVRAAEAPDGWPLAALAPRPTWSQPLACLMALAG